MNKNIKNNNQYICIGYDIRYEKSFNFSADLNVWDRDEDYYESTLEKYSIKENCSQLMNVAKKDLGSLSMELEKNNHCLISIEMGLDFYNQYEEEYVLSKYDLLGVNKIFLGYDICDLNGFFSFFDISKSDFIKYEISRSRQLCMEADILYPEHSPFILLKLSKVFRAK